jgi:hypothetical protein
MKYAILFCIVFAAYFSECQVGLSNVILTNVVESYDSIGQSELKSIQIQNVDSTRLGKITIQVFDTLELNAPIYVLSVSNSQISNFYNLNNIVTIPLNNLPNANAYKMILAIEDKDYLYLLWEEKFLY